MSNVSKNETQEIGNMTPFMQMMLTDVVGAEMYDDFNASSRMSAIEEAVKVRVGYKRTHEPNSQYSFQFVVQQALERYFRIIRDGVVSINFTFTESEMIVILNANCGVVCSKSVGGTVAGMVAADLGIEQLSDLAEDSDLKILFEKLTYLSPLQEAALIDICERFWRNAKDLNWLVATSEYGEKRAGEHL